MPNYNCAGFIAEAIESVLAQTVPDWQLIICDDNSSDDSVAIINDYAANDQRIKLVMNDIHTRGSAYCRNLALKQATGEYIAFLDSDDIWYPQKLEQQLAFMKQGNIAISYTAYDVMPEAGEKIHTIIPSDTVDYELLLKGKWMHTSTIMLKRSIPIEFPPLPTGQDIAMWLTLFRSGQYFGHGLLTSLAAYRLRKNSSSANKLHTIRLHWIRIKKQKNIPFPKALYYFSCYALNMMKKYISILPEVLRLR